MGCCELEILSIPGVAECRVCGRERSVSSYVVACPCGSFDVQILAGNELRIREVEVI